jgi:RNA polymerase sigma factor (sigma-70 family)
VTQAVFLLLSKKAAELPPKVVLGGWLYKTAVYACSNARQLQRTRTYHESRVNPMKDQEADNPVERAEMEGLLDEALMELSEAQREVLVLRFFESKPLTEIAKVRGETLYATEKAHNTGLEKLRRFLAKRGVTTTAAVVIAVMAEQATYAAPAGLAAACSTAAATGATVSIGVTEIVTQLVAQAARWKFFAGASMALGCVMLATTLFAATALMPTGSGHAIKAPVPAIVPAAPALSGAQEATEIAALLETLKRVEGGLRTMDHEGLAEVVTFTNLRQAKQWNAMARVFAADLRLKQTAEARLGAEGRGLTTIQTFGERLDEILPAVLPESCRWRVGPAEAVVQWGYRDGARAGGTLFFVKDEGRWKLDAGRSMDIVLEGLTAQGAKLALDRLRENEQDLVLGRMERLERTFTEVEAAIAAGKIRELAAARRALEASAGESPGRAFFHIVLKYDEIEQSRSVQ